MKYSLLIVLSLVTIGNATADILHITTKTGFQYHGEVDGRTDTKKLWLKRERDRMTIRRAFAWDSLNRIADADGRSVQREQILKQVPSVNDQRANEIEQLRPIPQQPPSAKAPVRVPRMMTLDFAVQPANWDQDVEWDGLMVHLYPLDGNRELTLAAGTLHVELHTAVRKWMRRSTNHGRMTGKIENWTLRIAPNAIGQPIYLPFRKNHPEFNTEISPIGLVHVRLVVPGQGVFHASHDFVRTRPFAPHRDLRERIGLPRFLPNERNSGLAR